MRKPDNPPGVPGNASQRAAICHRDGPCRVLAGPGSGKTFVIVQRLKHLIEQGGIDPSKILTITFTRAAAEEMKRRFDKLTEHKYPETAFGTFHSIFYNILKQSGHPASETPGIITETEKQNYMKMILTDLHDTHPELTVSSELCSLWLSEIARLKGEGAEVQDAEIPAIGDVPYRELFPKAYFEYLRMCREFAKLDFEDMIGMCLQLFREKPDVLEKWRARFPYIQIDEYQDINRMQSDVVRLLAAPVNNLFIVGDDDQSIYGFRGSRPDIMLGFDEMYPGAKHVLLNINYRCRRNILEASTRVIRENRVRVDKETIPGRTEEEGEVRICSYEDREAEVLAIREELKRSAQEGQASFCIIVRTNSQAKRIAQALSAEGAETAKRENVNPYTTAEVQDILAYLRLSIGHHCGADSSKLNETAGPRSKYGTFGQTAAPSESLRDNLLRILNKPLRYLSRESLRNGAAPFEEMRAYYADRPRFLAVVADLERNLRMISSMKPALAIRYIRTVIGYDAYVRNSDASTRQITADETIRHLDILQQEAGAYSRTEMFLREIENRSRLMTAKASPKKQPWSSDGKIPVITMHAAKGLEFDTVWIPSVNEGIIPSRKSITPGQIEEERRLFYVAMTRARRRLIISSLTGDENYAFVPSRFLRAIKGVGGDKRVHGGVGGDGPV